MREATVIKRRDSWRWIPAAGVWSVLTGLLTAAVLAMLVLVLLREPEVLVRDGPTPPIPPPTAEARAAAERLAAEARSTAQALQAVLRRTAAYQCPLDTYHPDTERLKILEQHIDAAARRHGTIGEPAALPTAQAEATPEARTPPLTAGTTAQKPIDTLSSTLEKAVVFIIPVNRGKVAATGTGFFIAPGLIATNRHVIETADPQTIIVTNEALGDIVSARVIARSASGQPGEPDFALLQTEAAVAPEIIPLSTRHHKLMDVLAAGYPGLALGTDAGFKRLASGDRTAAPDMHQNRGEIRSTQQLSRTTSIIHTADVLGGYSGGPLIDLCGRAVGINTFIRIDQQQSGKFNSALSAADLVAFLTAHGVDTPVDEQECEP